MRIELDYDEVEEAIEEYVEKKFPGKKSAGGGIVWTYSADKDEDVDAFPVTAASIEIIEAPSDK